MTSHFHRARKFPGLRPKHWRILAGKADTTGCEPPSFTDQHFLNFMLCFGKFGKNFILVSFPTENPESVTIEIHADFGNRPIFCFSGSLNLSPPTHLLTFSQQSLESPPNATSSLFNFNLITKERK